MSATISTCQICNQTSFKYCCPRCNILYCSLACYKSSTHLQCTEQFYRKCVEDELASASGTAFRGGGAAAAANSNFNSQAMNEGIRRMHEILQRVNDPQDPNQYDFDMDTDFEKLMNDEEVVEDEEALDSDDENNDDLIKRFEGVNLNDVDAVWERLTSNERYEFKTLLQTGEISKYLPPCKVWWEIQEHPKLIEEISTMPLAADGKNEIPEEIIFSYPEILGNIPPINDLTQKEPSHCVHHNITNVLASYVYMVRFFNSEHRQTPQEAVNCLYTLSATLKANANFDSDELALKSVIYEGQLDGLGLSDEEYLQVHEDVRKIVEGRIKGKRENSYILSALSDIHRLLTVAKLTKSLKPPLSKATIVNSDETNTEKSQFYDVAEASSTSFLFLELDRRKLNQLIKKVEYFLSYVNSKTNN